MQRVVEGFRCPVTRHGKVHVREHRGEARAPYLTTEWLLFVLELGLDYTCIKPVRMV